VVAVPLAAVANTVVRYFASVHRSTSAAGGDAAPGEAGAAISGSEPAEIAATAEASASTTDDPAPG
jgi:hypothetical protein